MTPDLNPITTNPVEVVAQAKADGTELIVIDPKNPPAANAVVTQPWTRIFSMIAVGLTALATISHAGFLPPAVAVVADSILGIMVAIGIASPGIRKQA